MYRRRGGAGSDDLDAFFDRLVASWQGWQGEQVWEALVTAVDCRLPRRARPTPASASPCGRTTFPTHGKPARPSWSTLARTCAAWPAGLPASWRPSASSRTSPSQITQQPTSNTYWRSLLAPMAASDDRPKPYLCARAAGPEPPTTAPAGTIGARALYRLHVTAAGDKPLRILAAERFPFRQPPVDHRQGSGDAQRGHSHPARRAAWVCGDGRRNHQRNDDTASV